MSADLAGLEGALGHVFQNRNLLVRALTHRSRLFDPPLAEADNEQFEFLGDSILGFLVSEYLVALHGGLREGPLSKLKAHLVSEEHLYQVAQQMGLGEYLVLGRSEEKSGGRLKRALLADAVEALIAALYLDGGMEASRRFVMTSLLAGVADLSPETGETLAHSKTTLQEIAQKKKLPMPRYRTVREEGPHHARTFIVEAQLGEGLVSEAAGPTKKSAEQRAAQLLLDRLKEEPLV